MNRPSHWLLMAAPAPESWAKRLAMQRQARLNAAKDTTTELQEKRKVVIACLDNDKRAIADVHRALDGNPPVALAKRIVLNTVLRKQKTGLLRTVVASFPNKYRRLSAAPYAYVISFFAQLLQSRRVEEIWAEMLSLRISPTADAYTARLLSLRAPSEGNAKQAVDVFTEMVAAGTAPTVYVYLALISVLLTQRVPALFEQAVAILEHMLSRPPRLLPDPAAIVSFLCAERSGLRSERLPHGEIYCEERRKELMPSMLLTVARSPTLFKAELLAARFALNRADPPVARALLSACVASSDVEKAKQVFNRVKSPTERCFNGLAHVHQAAGDVDGVLHLLTERRAEWRKKERSGTDPSSFTADDYLMVIRTAATAFERLPSEKAKEAKAVALRYYEHASMSASINSAHVFTALIRMAGDDWQFAETLRQQQQQCSVAESDAFRQQLKCVYEKAGLQDKARAVSKMASLPHAVVTRVHQI